MLRELALLLLEKKHEQISILCCLEQSKRFLFFSLSYRILAVRALAACRNDRQWGGKVQSIRNKTFKSKLKKNRQKSTYRLYLTSTIWSMAHVKQAVERYENVAYTHRVGERDRERWKKSRETIAMQIKLVSI